MPASDTLASLHVKASACGIQGVLSRQGDDRPRCVGSRKQGDGLPRCSSFSTYLPSFNHCLVHWFIHSLTPVFPSESMSILDRHRQLFAEFATPDNVLDRDGLRAIMQSVGSEVVPLNWLTDEDIDAAMEAYDSNRDGVISREEFEQMAKDNVFLLRSLSEYRQIFDSLDTGKNNLIGPTEMYRYFEDQKCGDGVGSFERVERLVRRYDLNNDGSIDFSEFLRLCRNEDVLPLEEILCYVKAGTGTNDCGNIGKGEKSDASRQGEGSNSVSMPSLDRSKVHVMKSPDEFHDIMSSVSDTTVVVLFASLTWCRPCKKVQPQLEKMADAYGEACDVVFLKIYGNESDALKSFFKEQLKVRVTPSFFFFTGGKLVESTTGA
jgi:Ca2+-binding EF-hand superfamily protein/thiol-disulfide isomerase/thioredoxin